MSKNDPGPEYWFPERYLEKTGDLRYAAIAFGKWDAAGRDPRALPMEALKACRKAYEEALRSTSSIVEVRRGPKSLPLDLELLEKIAGGIAALDYKSRHAAITAVVRSELGDRNLETDTKRLLRQLQTDDYEVLLDNGDGSTETVKGNYRIERHLKKHLRGFE